MTPSILQFWAIPIFGSGKNTQMVSPPFVASGQPTCLRPGCPSDQMSKLYVANIWHPWNLMILLGVLTSMVFSIGVWSLKPSPQFLEADFGSRASNFGSVSGSSVLALFSSSPRVAVSMAATSRSIQTSLLVLWLLHLATAEKTCNGCTAGVGLLQKLGCFDTATFNDERRPALIWVWTPAHRCISGACDSCS